MTVKENVFPLQHLKTKVFQPPRENAAISWKMKLTVRELTVLKMTKEYQFKDFSEAVSFINKLAPYCNEINHHPDIHVYYNKIIFDLKTHDAGDKVTEKDYLLAKEIERLYLQRQRLLGYNY